MLWRADPAAVGATLQRTAWPFVAAAVLLVLIDRLLMGYRWIALLVTLDETRRPPLRPLLRIFFESTFIGTFLPAGVGADAVRTWSLSRLGVSGAQSLASVLMDRLLGVLGVVVAAIGGLLLVPDLVADRVVAWSLVLAAAGCVVGAAIVFSERVDDVLRRRVTQSRSGRVHQIADRVLSALQAYRSHRGVLGGVLAASVGVQVLRSLQAALLGASIGLEVPIVAYLAAVPVIVLIMQIPITVSGLGTSQVGFELLFTRFGATSADAIALSLLFVALGTVGNLPGALLYLTGGRKRRAS
jgi:uncharacterized protein (TIRG00374 family)